MNHAISPNTPEALFGLRPLHEVSQGRLFRRETGDGRCLHVGLLELPKDCPDEHIVTGRVNSQLWLDLANPIDPFSRRPSFYRGDENGVGGLGEYSVADIVMSIKFGAYAMSDMTEFFLRKSALPHQNPDLAWVIVTGAAAHSLKAMPQNGLYEFKSGVNASLVDANPRNGEAFAGLLRHPMWGPDGEFGLSHSLSLKTYPHWIKENRQQNMRADPLFAQYIAKREALGGRDRDYYSKAEHAQDSLVAAKLIKELLEERESGAIPLAVRDSSKRPLPKTR